MSNPLHQVGGSECKPVMVSYEKVASFKTRVFRPASANVPSIFGGRIYARQKADDHLPESFVWEYLAARTEKKMADACANDALRF